MSRYPKGQFVTLKHSVILTSLLCGLIFPMSVFAQTAGPERPLNSGKLPFLREASVGGNVTSSGIGANGLMDIAVPATNTETVKKVQVEQGGLESQTNNCRFKDISGLRSETAINYLYDKGIAGGRRPCYFDPNLAVTRAEVTTMVVRATEISVPTSPTPPAFPDTNVQSWSAKHVKAAKNADIVHGYPDGEFKADKPANVVETLKITTRGFNSDFSFLHFEQLSKVTDISLDQWYVKYVQAGFNEGLIIDNAVSISPASEVTRSEAAEIIFILMNRRRQY